MLPCDGLEFNYVYGDSWGGGMKGWKGESAGVLETIGEGEEGWKDEGTKRVEGRGGEMNGWRVRGKGGW